MSSIDPALLWALHTLAPGRTGIGRYVAELTLALLAAPRPLDYELCAASERGEPDWLPPGHAVRRVRGPRRLVHALWLASRWPRLERLAGPASVVHLLHPAVPVPSRAPLVVTLHDVFPITNPEWYPQRRTRAGFARALARTEQEAAAVIATSTATAAAAVATHPGLRGRITVVPLGIADAFRVRPPDHEIEAARRRHDLPRPPYAIAVGRINARKNLPLVVRALARTPPPLRLVIAGPESHGSGALDAAIAAEGVADRVVRLGWVDDADLPVLVAGATSLVHVSSAEGFGLVPLEAMAVGTPAVVAADAALAEVVGGAATVVPSGDADALAEAMAALAADPERRAVLSGEGRDWAGQYTWQATADATAAVHEAVVGGRS